MSWLDSLQSELIITTGDGREFKPLWVPSSKSLEFNVAEFEFPEVEGTLVKRGTAKGRKFSFEIYFQGEDFLDQSNAFEESTKDSRPWVISHPYYNNIVVQPVALTFDNTTFNNAKITGTLIETITEDRPKISIDPIDKIVSDKEILDGKLVAAFDVEPSVEEVAQMNTNNSQNYNLGIKLIELTTEFEEYFNLFNQANTAIDNATAFPLKAISTMQSVINYPARTLATMKNRINLVGSQFNSLRNSLIGIASRAQKKLFENNGACLISSMALAASHINKNDFPNKSSVLDVVEKILDTHRTYLEDLDSIQSSNGGDPESYIPDADSITALNDLIKFTVSNLYAIALGAKQERTVILEDDSNIIILAHRFYGLNPDDSTINELIDINNIGLTEILQIKKGRSIVYYI